MFKKCSGLVLAFIITLTISFSIVPNRSEAIVGLIFKNRIVKTIGGATALGGGALVGVYYAIAGCGAACSGSWPIFFTAFFSLYFGVVMAGFGILVLDDGTLMEIEFSPMDSSNQENLQKFSQEEIETFNEELPLLNSIRQTVLAQVNNEADTKDAEKLWLDNAHYLSSATKKVASTLAKEFVTKSDQKLRNNIQNLK